MARRSGDFEDYLPELLEREIEVRSLGQKEIKMSRFFYLVLFLAASLLKSGQSCTVYKGGENVRVNLHSRHR